MPPIKNKNQTKAAAHGKNLLHWQFPEFNKYERGVVWYFLMGCLALGLLIYCLIAANFLFAIIILLIIFILFLHHKHEPQTLDFKIMEDGLEIGEDYLPYKNIKKFWIIYEPPTVKNLYFETYAALKREVSIPLQNTNPIKVRRLLLNYLEEDLTKEDESSADRWSRWLKI